jgi:hypothetical protein
MKASALGSPMGTVSNELRALKAYEATLLGMVTL